jgi:hypothetical protein
MKQLATKLAKSLSLLTFVSNPIEYYFPEGGGGEGREEVSVFQSFSYSIKQIKRGYLK